MTGHPTPAPPASTGPAGNGSRTPILVIGAIAIVMVVGLFAWNGGGNPDVGDLRGSGGGLPSGFGEGGSPGVGGGSDSGGDASATVAPGYPTDGDAPVTVAPFTAFSLVPSGVVAQPKGSGRLEWVAEGQWEQIADRYVRSFPAPGYELYVAEPRAGGTSTIGYDILPIGSHDLLDRVGSLIFSQHDVEDTRTLVEFLPH